MDLRPGGLTLQELAGADQPALDLAQPAYASSLAASIVASRLNESAIEYDQSFAGGPDRTFSVFAESFAREQDGAGERPGRECPGDPAGALETLVESVSDGPDGSDGPGESESPETALGPGKDPRPAGVFRGVQLSREGMELLSRLSLASEVKRQRVASDLRKAGDSQTYLSSLFPAPRAQLSKMTAGQAKAALAGGMRAYFAYLEALLRDSGQPGSGKGVNGAKSAKSTTSARSMASRAVFFISPDESDALSLALHDLYGEEVPVPRTARPSAGASAEARASGGRGGDAPRASRAPGSPAPSFLRIDGFLRETHFPRIYGREAGRQRASELFSALERYGNEPDGPCAREALAVKLALELHPQGPERVLEGVRGLWEQVGERRQGDEGGRGVREGYTRE